jgi:hypothetical protein
LCQHLLLVIQGLVAFVLEVQCCLMVITSVPAISLTLRDLVYAR